MQLAELQIHIKPVPASHFHYLVGGVAYGDCGIGIYLGFKPEFSKLIGFLIVALIAVGLVFNAGSVKDVLLELFNKNSLRCVQYPDCYRHHKQYGKTLC